jgi:hypothetical protein
VQRRLLFACGAVSILSLSCVWLVAFQTATYAARYSFVGLAAMATLLALALQRWPLAVRWMLPAVAFFGCLAAIQQAVLGIPWTY